MSRDKESCLLSVVVVRYFLFFISLLTGTVANNEVRYAVLNFLRGGSSRCAEKVILNGHQEMTV